MRIRTAYLCLPAMVPMFAAIGAPPAGSDVPVFPTELSGRRFQIIGPVRATIRLAPFRRDIPQSKVYRELWERGRRLGADAVIRARYGDPHASLVSLAQVEATGIAVRFVGPAPVAQSLPSH